MRRILLGTIAAVMGFWMLWFVYSNTAKIRASASWPTADGLIVQSVVARDSTRIRGGGYNHRYRVDVSYRYEVNGKQYESNTITFGVVRRFPTEAEAQSDIAKWPEQRHVYVYYDPKNPATSCLLAGEMPDIELLTWMAAGFALAGLIAICSGVWSRRTHRR